MPSRRPPPPPPPPRRCAGQATGLGVVAGLLVVLAACACAPRGAQAPVADPAPASDPAPLGHPPPPGDPANAISFTTQEGTHLAFDLSPDGEWIVFDLLGQLWRVPAGGGGAVSLTDAVAEVAEDLDPAVSPDGRWIAFHSDRPGGRGLWVVPATGGGARLLSDTETPARARVAPSWSPDGGALAFVVAGELVVHELAADRTRRVELRDAPEGRVLHAAWLPDGTILVATAAGGGWLGPTAIPDATLRVVDPATGVAAAVVGGSLPMRAPAPSPDGGRVAYFAPDDAGDVQLWVRPLVHDPAGRIGPGGRAEEAEEAEGADRPRDVARAGLPGLAVREPALRLTSQPDVVPLRARWSADGGEVLYAAEGRLWAVAAGGGTPRPIPFTAHVRLDRHEPPLPPVRFPDPGAEVRVRGDMGFALSPAADRVALIALGRLWVWSVGDDAPPQPVADLPVMAGWPSWSPAGDAVVWSAGRAGAEDLYRTELATGETRRLTRLPGRAARPVVSPDGGRIAFFHRPGMADPEFNDFADRSGGWAVIPVQDDVVDDPTHVHRPPAEQVLRLSGWYTGGGERPAWSPAGDELLVPPEQYDGFILPLRGDAVPLDLPGHPTFLAWAADSSLVYVDGNRIWRAALTPAGLGEPELLVDEPALYPSVARDGSVLFVGTDGFRLRRPDGGIQALGWPLSYRVPVAPPVLVRGARIIDGTGAPPTAPSDLLLRDGRIHRIEPAGGLAPEPGVRVIEAAGRVVLPGLIDLHQHGWEEEHHVYAASLYHGATTVREMGGPIALAVAVGEAAAAGVHEGPRVVVGGFQLYPGADVGVSAPGYQRLRTAAEGERALALAGAFGASYIKMRMPLRGPDAAALVREARDRGLRVGGHCAHQFPLIAAGIDQIEHLNHCDDRSAVRPRDDLVQLYRHAGVRAVPTLAVAGGPRRIRADEPDLQDDPDIGPLVPPVFRRSWRWIRDRPRDPDDEARYLRGWQSIVSALHDGGVAMATGTDIPALPGAIHVELEGMVAAGLSPLEAIVAATANAARVLGADAEIGTIAVGKRADLLILDADPLDDIRNTRRIHEVILDGRVVDRDGILRRAGAR